MIDFDVASDGANRATVRAVSADGQQVLIEHWTADGAVEELHRRDGT